MMKAFAVLCALLIAASLGGCADGTYEPVSADLVYADGYSDTVVLRFYYLCRELDPNLLFLPEAFLYVAEAIDPERIDEEFIRLMYEHRGIGVLGLHFDGGKVYVDLRGRDLEHFGFGSSAAWYGREILSRTVASIPDITSFELMTDGRRSTVGDKLSLNFVATVENGRIVGKEYFDPTLTLRFYYLCRILDPYFRVPSEAFVYVAEVVYAERIEEEFIRLMYEHMGVGVLSLHFDGGKAYIDFRGKDLERFGVGTTMEIYGREILSRTVASIPATSFEVRVYGQCWDFGFGH